MGRKNQENIKSLNQHNPIMEIVFSLLKANRAFWSKTFVEETKQKDTNVHTFDAKSVYHALKYSTYEICYIVTLHIWPGLRSSVP